MPFDVRWRLCPTVRSTQSIWAAPRGWGKAPGKDGLGRKVRDLPHIKRHSRESQQRLDVFHWPAEDGAITAFDNWSLNQIGMLDHERDDLIFRQFRRAEAQVFIDLFTRAQK